MNDFDFVVPGLPNAKLVPDFPVPIYVTAEGQVWWNGKIRTGFKGRYRRVCIMVGDNVWKKFSVHSLVAAAFIGPRPEGYHIDHIDFDRDNNAASNLRYLPALENCTRWSKTHG